MTWATADLSKPRISWISAGNYQEHTAALESASFPFTGKATVELWIYVPYHTTANNAGFSLVIDCSLLYKLGGTDDPQDEFIHKLVVDSTHDLFEYEVYHGDGPDVVSQNALRLSDGSLTDKWHRFAASENLGWEEIVVNDIAEILCSQFTKRWGGDIIHKGDNSNVNGEVLFPFHKLHMTVVKTVAQTINYTFGILGMEFDLEEDLYSVNLAEIKSQTFVSVLTNPHPPAINVPGPVPGPKPTPPLEDQVLGPAIEITEPPLADLFPG